MSDLALIPFPRFSSVSSVARRAVFELAPLCSSCFCFSLVAILLMSAWLRFSPMVFSRFFTLSRSSADTSGVRGRLEVTAWPLGSWRMGGLER